MDDILHRRFSATNDQNKIFLFVLTRDFVHFCHLIGWGQLGLDRFQDFRKLWAELGGMDNCPFKSYFACGLMA